MLLGNSIDISLEKTRGSVLERIQGWCSWIWGHIGKMGRPTHRLRTWTSTSRTIQVGLTSLHTGMSHRSQDVANIASGHTLIKLATSKHISNILRSAPLLESWDLEHCRALEPTHMPVPGLQWFVALQNGHAKTWFKDVCVSEYGLSTLDDYPESSKEV